MSPPTMAELPADLRRQISRYSSDCQAKLLELYSKYNFSDIQLETFDFNSGGTVNADKLPEFQKMLDKEMASKTKSAAAKEGAGVKRRRDSMAFLAGTAGLDAALSLAAPRGVAATAPRAGAAAAAASQVADPEALTPAPKRAREDGTPARGTPENPPKPLQVSLAKSVNNGNMSKLPTGASQPVSVKVLGDSQLWSGRERGYLWMDEALDDRAAERDKRLVALEGPIAQAMMERHPNEEIVAGVVGVATQQETVLVGRVVCEGLDGKLNERSILLEGSRATSKGARVQLNVAECPQIAAFPGQIVGVLGRSGMAGTTFHARDLIPGLPTRSQEPAGPSSPLHMMVLSGPFCLRDGLNFTPLEQALEHAARERPQVLVLLGPFLDASNQQVSSGNTVLPNEDEPCSFEEVYSCHILPTLARKLAPLRRASPPMEVLLVPSLDEVLCFHPLPQPPLDVSLGNDSGIATACSHLKGLGVKFLPNPAHVEISGLKVSLTSADALSSVLRAGLVLRPEERKIDEALRMLLLQRTLFPVLPRDPPQVSETRASAFDFAEERKPDLVIFPSVSGTASGTFIDGTLFVNPGPLCRPATQGTFAELWMTPPADKGAAPIMERARIDIQKLS